MGFVTEINKVMGHKCGVVLDVHVKEMRALAKHLVRYSFPQAPAQNEEDLSCLKQREINVDGYDIVVYFNRCKYRDVEMETLQVFGKYFTFLPFSVICKVAYKFLGDKELSLIEIMHYRHEGVMDEHSRKIYVWTVYYDEDGEPMASPFVSELKSSVYDGLRFSHMDRSQITFF